MTSNKPSLGARLRVVVAPGVGIGPGKAGLLEAIHDTGSISAAGRRLGMSYKRAWYLVETMNGHFGRPLVEATKGGKAGGGAKLTPLGVTVLTAFREMEAATDKAIAPILRRLRRKLVTDIPE
jgi:molybdate transport system regulatory protein